MKPKAIRFVILHFLIVISTLSVIYSSKIGEEMITICDSAKYSDYERTLNYKTIEGYVHDKNIEPSKIHSFYEPIFERFYIHILEKICL